MKHCTSALVLLLAIASVAYAGPTFFVNSTADNGDINRGNGLCVTFLGECTLRAAIQELNTRGGFADQGIIVLISGSTYTLTNKGPENAKGFQENLSDGGGIWNSFGSLTIENSTISGNKAEGNGGGIFNFAEMRANNTTIANNIADSDGDGSGDGGGIFNRPGESVTLVNTILAANLDQSSATKLPDCAGTIDVGSIFSFGYNLIQNLTGCTIQAFSGSILGKSPLLGPLQNNGGVTLTHKLGLLSPALDAGSPSTTGRNACLALDQRSAVRGTDGNGDGIARCDIGAYEAAAFTRLTFTLGVPSLEPVETTVYAGQHVTYNFGWTVPGPGWRVLDNLQLRISDEQGVAFWLRFQEITGSQGAFSLINAESGEPGPAFPPGSPNRLETRAATLYLATSYVVGPPGSQVGLNLDLSFKPFSAGRTYQVEAMAVDDTGLEQDFTVVGVISVQ